MNEASRQSTDQIVQLLTNVQQQLTRYVRTLVPNRTDAEEVLQETNLFVWRHADEFELGTNFAAWACRIAYYQVLTFRRWSPSLFRATVINQPDKLPSPGVRLEI